MFPAVPAICYKIPVIFSTSNVPSTVCYMSLTRPWNNAHRVFNHRNVSKRSRNRIRHEVTLINTQEFPQLRKNSFSALRPSVEGQLSPTSMLIAGIYWAHTICIHFIVFATLFFLSSSSFLFQLMYLTGWVIDVIFLNLDLYAF